MIYFIIGLFVGWILAYLSVIIIMIGLTKYPQPVIYAKKIKENLHQALGPPQKGDIYVPPETDDEARIEAVQRKRLGLDDE